MKRKYLIVLVAQSCLIVLMLVFSIFQKTVADKSLIKAEEIQKRLLEIERKYNDLVKETTR